MSLTQMGNISLDEFRRAVHDAVSQDESLTSRFARFSASGDRRGMVEMLMEMPYVTGLKPGNSYQGKDDARAARLYEKSLAATTEPGDERTEEIRTCNILTQALFAASANGRVFLDAICERARRSYGLRAYANCLRDCECMLALPASFYDDSAENVKHFVQRRKECLQLERECSRKLEAASSRKRGGRRKISFASFSSSRSSSSGALPTIDGKAHGYLTSCPDSVELGFDQTRGRHLVATRDIRPGTVLIVDRPFSFSTDAPALGRNCLHCHATLKLEDSVRIPCRDCQTVSFCTETCRKEAWETYHRYECPVFNYFFKNSSKNLSEESQQTSYFLLTYRTTIVQALRNNAETTCALNPDFLRYHANGNAKDKDDDISKECADLGSKKIYSPLDYRTVFQLETHCTDMEPHVNLIRTIDAIFFAKCLTSVLSKLDIVCTREIFVSLAVAMLHHLQAIICNAYEIVENVRDEMTHVWEPRNIGGAIYTTVSLVNHSCYPNVVRHSYPNGAVVVRALRFIGKGCEILDCYGPHFFSESRLIRREFLWKKYRFLCGCEACKQNWKFPLPETTNYKCTMCSEPMNLSIINATINQQCAKCEKTIDLKRIEKQFRKSVQKRLDAVAKMYQGDYRGAMPLLFEHVNFVNKYLAEPNIEGIKTEQCIVQCYNSLGSISV
ncbi:hypothetical protein P5V15_003391 [Pogonomyrmex californicus]